MKTDILQAIFPSIILDNFDIINYQETLSSERIDIYLDEKKIIPEELKDLQVISHGFREAKDIQDFGKSLKSKNNLDFYFYEVNSKKIFHSGSRSDRSLDQFKKWFWD